jgi:hypothetical protein
MQSRSIRFPAEICASSTHSLSYAWRDRSLARGIDPSRTKAASTIKSALGDHSFELKDLSRENAIRSSISSFPLPTNQSRISRASYAYYATACISSKEKHRHRPVQPRFAIYASLFIEGSAARCPKSARFLRRYNAIGTSFILDSVYTRICKR